MTETYRGTFGTICAYNFDEFLRIIASGEWFKTGDLGYYYRAIPYGEELPEGVVFLECRYTTAKSIKYKYFFNIKKSDYPKAMVYGGEKLKDFMCERMRQWALQMNPKTLRAFDHGRPFESYLKAIPRDLLDERFVERLEESLKNGFVERIQSMPSSESGQYEDVKQMMEKTSTLFNEIVKGSAQTTDNPEAKKKINALVEEANKLF